MCGFGFCVVVFVCFLMEGLSVSLRLFRSSGLVQGFEIWNRAACEREQIIFILPGFIKHLNKKSVYISSDVCSFMNTF